MAEVKIIQPPVIEVTPLQTATSDMYVNEVSSPSTSKSVNDAPTLNYRSLPRPEHAKEVISNKLDTLIGKIKQTLEFTHYGALKIGKFIEGETGEITITGDGITATDIKGRPTFGLNGQNGDAYFSGELAAKSIITGRIDIGRDGYIIGGDQITYRWILGKLP
jgi:hypothetical protein